MYAGFVFGSSRRTVGYGITSLCWKIAAKVSARIGNWWCCLNTHETWNGWRLDITAHKRCSRTTSTYAGFFSASSRRTAGHGITSLRWKIAAKVSARIGNWWCCLNTHETWNGRRLDITAHKRCSRTASTYARFFSASSRRTARHGITSLRWKIAAKVRARIGNWWCCLNTHETWNEWRLNITSHQRSSRNISRNAACVSVRVQRTAGHRITSLHWRCAAKVIVRAGHWWCGLNTHETGNGWWPDITAHYRFNSNTLRYAECCSVSSRRTVDHGITSLRWNFAGNWWCGLNTHETWNGWRLDITSHQRSSRNISRYAECVSVSSRRTVGHGISSRCRKPAVKGNVRTRHWWCDLNTHKAWNDRRSDITAH